MAQPTATQRSEQTRQPESAAASQSSSASSSQGGQGQGQKQSPGATAKDAAAGAAHDAREGIQEAAQTVRSEATAVMGEAQTAARDAARQATEEGRHFLQRQKERAAEEVSHFESAIRRAAESLREEDDDNLADYADRAAAKLSGLKDYLNRQDLRQLLDDVENSARRRPELVFGGLLVAGLATARFLKASSRSRNRTSGPMRNFPRTSAEEGQPKLEYASVHQLSTYAPPVLETSQGGASGTSQTRSRQL